MALLSNGDQTNRGGCAFVLSRLTLILVCAQRQDWEGYIAWASPYAVSHLVIVIFFFEVGGI